MKKFLSLLFFVAVLAMSAWADTVVTVDFNAQGWDTGTLVTELTVDGVTLTFDKGTGGTKPTYYTNTSGGALRLYGGNTMTVSGPQNLKKIDFTFASGEGNNDILSDVGNYNKAGKQWTIGSSDPSKVVVFTIDGSTGHRRVQQLVITMEEAEPVTELVPPVFHPNGGEFTGSLAVTLTCATQNCDIFYFEGEPDGDWPGYTHYSGEFYVTETKTYTAYSSKGGEISDFVTVTFTKVEQTVAAPVFHPAAGNFYDRVNVTLSCSTPNAKIYYSLDNELWSEYSDAIPVTETTTIWAKAKVGDLESEVVSATYTKLDVTTVDVTFDGAVDTGDGDGNRHHFTVVKDPVTMYVGDGLVHANGHYRVYGPNDSAGIVFTTVNLPIIKIEFNGMSGYTASGLSKAEGNEGTWTTGGTDGVWEGNATEVAFKVNQQCRFTTITVTVAGAVEYERGDVNHDGVVNIADVTALIDYLLTDVGAAPNEADVMVDGVVNIADVTALIDVLLAQH